MNHLWRGGLLTLMRKPARHRRHQRQEIPLKAKQHMSRDSTQDTMARADTLHVLLDNDDIPPEAFVASERMAHEAETFDPDHEELVASFQECQHCLPWP